MSRADRADRPKRSIRKLIEIARAQASPELATPPQDLPLAALLLHGLTIDSEEGPALDVLTALGVTMQSCIDSTPAEEGLVTVSKGEMTMWVRRLEVGKELAARRAFFPGNFPSPATPAPAVEAP